MNQHDDRRGSVVKRALAEIRELRQALQDHEQARYEPIAIIGMACRFPGAGNVEAFWELLRTGTDAVTDIPADRFDVEAFYDPDPKAPGKSSTRRGGFVDNIDEFDAPFFGISPREASQADPQQRLFLEVAWEALENAGRAPDRQKGSSTGVFAGVTGYDYGAGILQQQPLEELDGYFVSGNTSAFVAGRLSYWLGLQGPSLVVDTACSSALVSVHLACQSLRAGDCTMAVAGGVNALLSPEGFVVLSKAGMLSADGRCATFDKDANGYVRGEGCGVVVLRRLSDALADHDRVLAVIRGSAVNQDGRSSSITVPNGIAQQAVIRHALTAAGVPGHRVGYVEAHGTGTALGDPIEVRALSAVLGENRSDDSPVTLGSVKTNIGHLESAAGAAGLIKTVLALRHEEIPPSLHLREVNPEIGIDTLPVSLATSLTPWPKQTEPRIAGVSSFGASGTNSHLVLEEAPAVAGPPSAVERPTHLVSMSARSADALKALAERYVHHLSPDRATAPADIGFTANTGRARFGHRLAVVADTLDELRDNLSDFLAGSPGLAVQTGVAKTRTRPKVAFLFTGQGSQYAAMGRALYETEPGFRADIDRCAEILRGHLDPSLLSVLFDDFGDGPLIDRTRYTQPVLFALEYALARLWMSWGVRPSAMLGHSVGEYAAACVAGVFSLEEGLPLVAERARLMDELPGDGAMATVFTTRERVDGAIASYADVLSIAAVNGPQSVVVSGEREPLEKVLEGFTAEGVKVKRLTVSQAFHSPLLAPMLDAFEKRAAQVAFRSPRIPLVSNLTGEMVGPATYGATYLRDHAGSAVLFADGVQRLVDRGCTVFVEIGAAPHLCSLAKNILGEDDHRWLPSLRRGKNDWQTVLRSLGALYAAGADIDWDGFDRAYSRHRVDLPTYPFERKRHWYAPPGRQHTHRRESSTAPDPVEAAPAAPSTRLLGQRLSSPLDVAQFHAELSTEAHPSLVDCLAGDLAVVNAGFYLEALAQAAEELYGSATLRAQNVLMPQALIVPDDGRVTAELLVFAPHTAPAAFGYHSLQTAGSGEWGLHARGALSPLQQEAGSTATSEVDAIRARCTTQVTGSAFYRSMWRLGAHLGPSAQWLSAIARRDGEALAELRAADDGEARQGYHLHPGVVDSALQLLHCCLPEEQARDVVVMLVEIGEYTFHGHDGGPLLCHAVLRSEPLTSETLTADILLMMEDGRHVARMSGALLKAIRPEAMLRGIKAGSAHRAPAPVLLPAGPQSAGSERHGPSLAALIGAQDSAAARATIRDVLLDAAASVLGASREDIDPEEMLYDIGLDSLLAVQLNEAVGAALGTSLPTAWFLDRPSVNGLMEQALSAVQADSDPAEATSSPATPVDHRGTERTGPGGMHIVEFGRGEPVVFVHGGAFGGVDAWQTQLPLAERWRLIVVSRLNYGESAASECEDFAEDGRLLAELIDELGEGVHLVAQSYGTLGAMLAAVQRPDAVRSLTLIESAASSIARGTPAVDSYELAMKEFLASPPEDKEEAFRALFRIIDPTADYPTPLPKRLSTFVNRLPDGVRWPLDAEVPVDALRDAKVRTLSVSGGRRPLFEEISDALSIALAGERLVIPGGHGTQNVGRPFNVALEGFLNRGARQQVSGRKQVTE